MRTALALTVTALALSLPAGLHADEAPKRALPTELLTKLADTSARFEKMMDHAAFTIAGRMGDATAEEGAFEATREGSARVIMHPDGAKVEILKYTEEGHDKTEEAKRKSDERAKESRKTRKSRGEAHLPFIASEQSKYDFWLGETDANDPARQRVFFHAKEPAENRMNGSAWVDARTGELLTASVTASKTGAFIDYLRVKLEFGERTSMGPAVSKLSFDTAGGFLFVRKHYRGSATLTSYDVKL